jgi:hypothetical protein
MSSCDIYIASFTLIKSLEVHMKLWFVNNILSADNKQMFESGPISDKEFTISITMVVIALALFGIVVRVLGA